MFDIFKNKSTKEKEKPNIYDMKYPDPGTNKDNQNTAPVPHPKNNKYKQDSNNNSNYDETSEKITNNHLYAGLYELKQDLITIYKNQNRILNLLKNKDDSSAMVLKDEELKYIPEEYKDYYFDLKTNQPKLAEVFLKGYKSDYEQQYIEKQDEDEDEKEKSK